MGDMMGQVSGDNQQMNPQFDQGLSGAPNAEVPMAQSDNASMLGMNPKQVNKMLNQVQKNHGLS